MYNRIRRFICEDIEKKFGIPQDLTNLFIDGKSSILPYAIVKVYQKYFGMPSFNELLDEYELAEYLLDEDVKFLPLRENEIQARDNSMYDVCIEKGDIIRYNDSDCDGYGLHVVEFEGIAFMAFILERTDDKIEFSFYHDDFGNITLKSDKIKVLGYANGYRKPNETSYHEILTRTFLELEEEFDD